MRVLIIMIRWLTEFAPTESGLTELAFMGNVVGVSLSEGAPSGVTSPPARFVAQFPTHSPVQREQDSSK